MTLMQAKRSVDGFKIIKQKVQLSSSMLHLMHAYEAFRWAAFAVTLLALIISPVLLAVALHSRMMASRRVGEFSRWTPKIL